MGMKYDVFISYSRKDYVDEHGNPREDSAVFKLMAFLDKHNITYWFDKDGIYSGSEFVEVITDAITESKMMIFVSSEHSNDSQWTTGEIFEALDQNKLIVPFKIDDSQYNKKFRLRVRPLDFIEYYASPEVAFESLLKAINVCRKEYEERIAEEARRKAEENARRHRAEIVEEIKVEALDFQHHVSTIAADAQKILEKQKQIGNIEKKCPVCSTQQPIENVYCKKCGWTFNPVFDEKPKGDKDHLFVMRSIWNAIRKSDAVRKEFENKIREQESVIEEKDVIIELLREELSQNGKLKEELSKAIRERDDLQQQLMGLKNKVKSLTDSFKVSETETQRLAEERARLSKNVSALQSELNGKNKEISVLQSKLKVSENNCVKLLSEVKNYKDKALREQQAREEAERKEAERQRQIAAENERKAREEAEKFNGHEYVDLGLPSGTLWATCNVGANRPEDYGNYYAWGETNTKNNYIWSTYKWCRGSKDSQTKYNTQSSFGTVDNRTVLEMSDDAAHVSWGAGWRMPTKEEWKELNDKCTRTWTTQGGKNGYRVTGPNGKSIFLPAAGLRNVTSLNDAGSYGYYWSSSLDTGFPYCAYFQYLVSIFFYMSKEYIRCLGFTVRPVCPPQD